MARITTLQALFKRYRRPGDIVFAAAFLVISLGLLAQLGSQTATKPGARLASQPWFWPALSLGGMSIFAALHLMGSALSARIAGRWREVGVWVASLEYAVWFVGYALLVPRLGYLPSTILFAVGLTLRSGYRGGAALGSAVGAAVAIVLVFKTFLQVKIPSGQIYDLLPDGIRQIMLTYF